MSNSDYIADLRRRLQEACRHAQMPEVAHAAMFSIGAGEMAAGGGPATEVSPPLRRLSSAPAQQMQFQKECQQPQADAGAGGRRSVSSIPPPALLQDGKKTPPSLKLPTHLSHEAAKPSVAADTPISEAESTEESGGEVSSAGGTYDEVASEVLRLRKLHKQHEELQQQFVKANDRVRKLPPHALLQFHGYLERAMAEPGQVQDSIIKLIESLCVVCGVEVVPGAAQEEVLMSVRRLLRDPHNFASKLSRLGPTTSDDAKSLAPCLLSASQYRKVRDKDAHVCCEALFGWISAFYYLSDVADQVKATARALDINERRLRELEGAPCRRFSSSPVRPLVGLSSLASPATGASRTDTGRRSAGSSGSVSARSAGSPRQKASPRRPSDGHAAAPGKPSGTGASPQVHTRTHSRELPTRRSSAGEAASSAPQASGVQRMQSDRALTSVLRALRKDRSAETVAPEAPAPAHGAGGAATRLGAAMRGMLGGGGGGGATPPSPQYAPPPRPLRQTGGTLPTVPERRASLPSTLLETLRAGQSSPSAPKRAGAGPAPPSHEPAATVKRSVTATPRLQ